MNYCYYSCYCYCYELLPILLYDQVTLTFFTNLQTQSVRNLTHTIAITITNIILLLWTITHTIAFTIALDYYSYYCFYLCLIRRLQMPRTPPVTRTFFTNWQTQSLRGLPIFPGNTYTGHMNYYYYSCYCSYKLLLLLMLLFI